MTSKKAHPFCISPGTFFNEIHRDFTSRHRNCACQARARLYEGEHFSGGNALT